MVVNSSAQSKSGQIVTNLRLNSASLAGDVVVAQGLAN